MSFYLAPIANQQQLDSSGNPLSGGKIATYIAGTSTPATTYTDDSGGTAQANPIVLNSRGLPASPVWLQGGRTYKLVITDANDVVLQTIDDVSGINDPAIASTTDQWVIYANAPTYINATSFSVAGDQTGTFQATRRVRTTNTGGTVYSSISASAYDAGTGLTTVTVVNDSGTLDSGLSQVSYGLLSTTNPAIPETTTGKALRTAASAAAAHAAMPIQSGTAVAASGTSVDFTSIPSWVKRITINLAGVSTSGTSNPIFQLGDSGGSETSGYLGAGSGASHAASWSISSYTAGFGLFSGSAAAVIHGRLVLELLDPATNTWTASGVFAYSNSASMFLIAGSKALSAALDRVRLTTAGGADTFDAGSININYE